MENNIEETEETFNNSFVDEPSDESQEEYEPINNDLSKIAEIVQNLKNSGALVQKPAEKFHCQTCILDFPNKDHLYGHIIEHVSLPHLVLHRIDEDDEFDENDDDADWSSDAEKSTESAFNPIAISQNNTNITKIGGITIKSNSIVPASLMSLTNIGNLSIKKLSNVNEAKEEDSDTSDKPESPINILKRIETSGSLRFTIKQSDKMFRIVNGTEKVKSEDSPKAEASEEINKGEKYGGWSEDNKDGILEKCTNVPIKTEPQIQNDETVHEVSNTLENIQVKSESHSRPQTPVSSTDSAGNQIKVKSFAMEQMEKKTQNDSTITVPKPMLTPKVESTDLSAIIEINCDSDKDDDEIIFVGATSLPDKKPPIGLPPATTQSSIKELSSSGPTITRSSVVSSRSSMIPSSSSSMSSVGSTEKQHSFNWNAPSTKINDTLESMLADKNNDSYLENILSNHRNDGISDLGASEYISLDKLGPQHTCDVCNVRFTSIDLLESHRKNMGHSNQLVTSGNSSNSLVLSTYQQPGFLMNSLLPVKQLADTVSKITSVNTSTAPFTHQQNIMVNIQSFPGNMNQPMGAQPHNAPSSYNYPGMPQMPTNYQQGFRMPNQNVPSQYPGQYPVGPQQPYPPSAYPQYPPHSSSQSLYGHQMNASMNANYPPQPYLQNQYGPQPGIPIPYPQTNMNQAIQSSSQNQQLSTPIIGQNVIPLSNSVDQTNSIMQQNNSECAKSLSGGIKIQSIQTVNGPVVKPNLSGPRVVGPRGEIRGQSPSRATMRAGRGIIRPGMRPLVKQGVHVGQSIRGGIRPGMRPTMKRSAPTNGTLSSPSKKRMDMLIPDKHDNEDCQQQRDGLPQIQNIQGSREKNHSGVHLSSQITVTKTKVRPPTPPPASKDASAVASMLASRGIKITQKPKTPPPAINIPNLGSNISITPSKGSSAVFSVPEDHDISCSSCNKTFNSGIALANHINQMHSSQKSFRCPSCPISYPTALQLQEHKLAFHNLPNAEIGLPVVDLSQLSTLRKLSNLGITNFIPLANREQGGGCFVIPIVSVQNALSGNISNSLSALSANGILSLGPVKPLPKC
ncbi:uncharacterized protein LOC143909945 isoform X2 [Arctopsyche grandis]|uniref:uncharacterized protein LOC143909945 isoform X2 n=1 Tax=Arctopsyche grandis TaxID=121162 RepID=UPI00406D8C8A